MSDRDEIRTKTGELKVKSVSIDRDSPKKSRETPELPKKKKHDTTTKEENK